jgi:DNA mismatch repair protein MutS
VNERASEILSQLEGARSRSNGAGVDPSHALRRSDRRQNGSAHSGRLQLTLFEYADHPLLNAIKSVDLDVTSPRDAIKLLSEWQDQLFMEKGESV